MQLTVLKYQHHNVPRRSITAHGGRGATKQVKNNHAIIYTGTEAPQPLPSELPNSPAESPLGKPIRIVPIFKHDKLDPLSRINFANIHNVEHNQKVYDFGDVHEDSIDDFIAQFNSAWSIPTLLPSNRRSWTHKEELKGNIGPETQNTTSVYLAPEHIDSAYNPLPAVSKNLLKYEKDDKPSPNPKEIEANFNDNKQSDNSRDEYNWTSDDNGLRQHPTRKAYAGDQTPSGTLDLGIHPYAWENQEFFGHILAPIRSDGRALRLTQFLLGILVLR